MSDAPETMFIDFRYQEYCTPEELPPNWNGAQEYTRADITAARIAALEEQRDELLEALEDSNTALGKFVDHEKEYREPYETPLSAYDRGLAAINNAKETQ